MPAPGGFGVICMGLSGNVLLAANLDLIPRVFYPTQDLKLRQSIFYGSCRGPGYYRRFRHCICWFRQPPFFCWCIFDVFYFFCSGFRNRPFWLFFSSCSRNNSVSVDGYIAGQFCYRLFAEKDVFFDFRHKFAACNATVCLQKLVCFVSDFIFCHVFIAIILVFNPLAVTLTEQDLLTSCYGTPRLFARGRGLPSCQWGILLSAPPATAA